MSLPRFNQISVDKKSITSYKTFKQLIELYNLVIIFDEPGYYILDGTDQDLHDFQKYWRDV